MSAAPPPPDVGPTAPAEGAEAHDQRPWLGLAAFTEDLSPYFCGRIAEADDLFRRVRRETLTVLFGTSGLGKTSLLRAGLFPALRADGFLPLYIRLDHADEAAPVSDQVKQAISEAIQRAGFGEAPSFQPGRTLWEFFHRDALRLRSWNDRPVTLVLVFDQFEELFTIGSRTTRARDEHAAFFTELADLAENRPPASVRQVLRSDPSLVEGLEFGPAPVRVVLSLREDYLANLEGLSGLMPSLARSRMRLTPMDGEQALEAVARPGAGLVTEPVARQIVAFVAAAGAARGAGQDLAAGALRDLRIEPALLSLFCRELNEQRLSQHLPRITPELIEHAGAGIIQGYYSSCFDGLPPGARNFVEEELLTSEGHRDDMELHRAHDAIERHGATATSLDTLIDRRLLHLTRRGDAQRIELTHDLLAGVASASRAARHTVEALEGARREQQEAADELRRAKEAAETTLAEQRRRARWIGAAALVILGVAVVAVFQWDKARRSERVAQAARDAAQESERKAVTARSDLQTVTSAWQGIRAAGQHFDTALLLATSAFRQSETSETRNALFCSVLSAPNLVAMLRGHRAGSIRALAYSPDSRLLATGDTSGTVILWHADNNLMAGPPIAVSAAVARGGLSFDPSGQRLIAASEDGTLCRIDSRSGEVKVLVSAGRPIIAAAFSADGSTVAVGCDDGTVGCWDCRSGSVRLPLTLHPDCSSNGNCATFAVALNRDGSTLLAAGVENRLFAWDVVSGGVAWSVPLDGRMVPVWSLAFDAECTSFAAGTATGPVSLWHTPLTPGEQTASTVPAGAPAAEPEQPRPPEDGAVAQRLWISGAQHLTGVLDVEFRGDGRYLGSASLDRACLWDLKPNESGTIPPARTMDGYADALSIAFRPLTADFVTGHQGGVIVAWNSELAPRIARQLDTLSGKCSDLAFADGGSALVVACGRDVVVLDGSTLKYRRTIRVGWWDVVAVAGHPSQSLVACADAGNAVTFLDISTGQQLGEPRDSGSGSISSLAFSLDGQVLASGNADGKILLWNVDPAAPAEPAGSLAADGSPVRCLAFGPRGLLASSTLDKLVHVWSVPGRTELGPALVGHVDQIYSLAFSPDGSRLASGGLRNGLMVWGGAGLGERSVLQPGGEGGTIAAVAWSRDGQALLSADWNGSVAAWDLATDEPPIQLPQFGSSITRLVVDPGGRRIACLDGNAVRLVDQDVEAEPIVLRPSLESLADLELSHDGRIIAASGAGNVSAWSSDKTASALDLVPSENARILFAPDDKTMLIAGNRSEPEVLTVWDMGRHEVVDRRSFPDGITALALDAQGRTLAVAGEGGDITLCDWPGLRPRSPVLHGTWPAQSLDFSHDGLQLLVCGNRYEGVVFEVSTPSSHPHTIQTEICAATFSPVDGKVALANPNGQVLIFDAHSGKRDFALQGPPILASALAFTPDGKFLVAGSDSFDDPGESLEMRLERNRIVVWDMEARRALDASLKLHQSRVVDLVFSPDGKNLFSADTEGHVLCWDFDVKHWLSQAASIPKREFTEGEAEIYFRNDRPPPIEDATTLRERADEASLRGDSEAEALFVRALAAARKADDAAEANNIAWFASIHGFVEIGLEAAEFAISRAPPDEFALYRDSRGLARARSHDVTGAIEDFSAYVAWAKARPDQQALASKRREWIRQLQEGVDPFSDRESALKLRDESYWRTQP